VKEAGFQLKRQCGRCGKAMHKRASGLGPKCEKITTPAGPRRKRLREEPVKTPVPAVVDERQLPLGFAAEAVPAVEDPMPVVKSRRPVQVKGKVLSDPKPVVVRSKKKGRTRRTIRLGDETFEVERRQMERVTITSSARLFDTWWSGEWDRAEKKVVRLIQVGEREKDISEVLSALATTALREKR